MRNLLFLTSIAFSSVFCKPAFLFAENWGHWRGPTGNGGSETARPPSELNAEHSLKWKVEISGRGSSSPIVWGNRVYITSAIPSQSKSSAYAFQLLCFDRQDGKLVWAKTAVEAVPHEGTHETNGFASASPCTDGKHVYAFFGSRGLFCFSSAGEMIWKRDFGDMRIRNGFGEGSSPTLVDDLVIVPWDHEGPSALYALDKTAGEIVWQTSRDEPTCWATPLVTKDSTRNKRTGMFLLEADSQRKTR